MTTIITVTTMITITSTTDDEGEAVVELILTNQEKILANQKTIAGNQKTLEQLLAGQKTIQANQKAILAGQKTIQANQKTLTSPREPDQDPGRTRRSWISAREPEEDPREEVGRWIYSSALARSRRARCSRVSRPAVIIRLAERARAMRARARRAAHDRRRRVGRRFAARSRSRSRSSRARRRWRPRSVVRKHGSGALPGHALGLIRVVRPATPIVEVVAEAAERRSSGSRSTTSATCSRKIRARSPRSRIGSPRCCWSRHRESPRVRPRRRDDPARELGRGRAALVRRGDVPQGVRRTASAVAVDRDRGRVRGRHARLRRVDPRRATRA